MFPFPTHSPHLVYAALATASWLAVAPLATAQAPRTVHVPPDVKGFAAQRMMQEALQAAPQHAAPAHVHRAPAAQISRVTVTLPDGGYVAIRGPDGDLRYFPVEGGPKGLASRVVVVHPGESVMVQLPPGRSRE